MNKDYILFIQKLLICFLYCLSLPLKAQHPAPNIKHFDEKEGFTINEEITDVKIDHQQRVWIVSLSKLCYYNGSSFHFVDVSTANHEPLLWFKETLDKKPFVIDMIGNVFFIESDTLRAYEYNHIIQENGQAKEYPKSIYFDQKNRLHIHYHETSYIIIDQGETLKPLKNKELKNLDLVCVMRANFQFVARGEFPENITKFIENQRDNKTNFILFNDSLEPIDTTEFNRVRYGGYPMVVSLPSKNYLLSTGLGNLIEYNTLGIQKVIYYPYDIFGLLIDTRGGLWISTKRDGVHYYPNSLISKKNRIQFFDNTTTKIAAEDFQGGLWMYSKENGLNYIPNPYLYNYNNSYSKYIDNSVNASGLVYNKILIGNKGRRMTSIDINSHEVKLIDYSDLIMNLSSSEKFLMYEKEDTLGSFLYDTLYTGIIHDSINNRTWIAQKNNLLYSNDKKWQHINLEAALYYGSYRNTFDPYIYPFNKNSQAIFGSIDRRFFKIKDSSVIYTSDSYPSKITNLTASKDSIVINCSGGVYLQTKDSVKYLGKQNPQLATSMKDMIYFNDSFWFSSESDGVLFLTDSSTKEFSYQGYSLKNSRFIKQNEKQLWIISSIANLLITVNKAQHETGSYSVEAFKPLPQQITIKHLSYNKKTLFIGTMTQGVFRIDFESLKKYPLTPPLLSVSTMRVNQNKQAINYDSIYKFSYYQNFFQFNYHATNFMGEPIKYRYRLNGLSNHWESTNSRVLQYPNLNDGEYSFEIQAAIGDQPWSPSKKINFVITPPFWETWWFITLAIVTVLFISYRIILYRIQIANREQGLIISNLTAKQEALQARMDPHFVFNVVASVQYLILNNENKRANVFLNMFSKAMRNILDQTDQNSLSIEQEIQFLREYINMERFRMEEKFDYKIHVDEISELLNDHIPSFLIQPFIENAIHHGFKNKVEKGNLLLSFIVEGIFLKVIIEDDGVGRKQANKFKQKKRHKSHGVNIIKERLDLHNKRKNNVITEDLTNDSGDACGTKVTLYIKRIKYDSINS